MPSFDKVLIANRGEIALRIVRAVRELGMTSVAVYSEADAEALHVKFADEAVCIGPGNATKSYLNIPAIISAAEITRAGAVHPGYGFLAENAEFADICQKCDLVWIGPQPEVISLMGDKIRARAEMQRAGVPVLPGSGAIDSEATLLEAVKRVGFPVILKASAGGGGRGMKIVESPERLVESWQAASSEAMAAFGNPEMYLERYCRKPRHIEVQIAGDESGHVIHLAERECSIQRRHQKVIEEAPCATLPEDIRTRLTQAAVKAGEAIDYHSLGTVEFLLSGDEFFFMEMNTRLQVEHPVTEQVMGVDLVREQIKLAMGAKISRDRTRNPRGHSIELRINAEDPETFAPSPGKITALNLPGGYGVRVDTHIYEGYVVPPYYDSLLAKLIITDESREEAIKRVRRCLDEFVVEGVSTNLKLHRRIVSHPDFVSGNIDTGFIARMLENPA